MQKYLVFLLVCLVCWSLVSLGSNSGHPKKHDSSTSDFFAFDCTKTVVYKMSVCCGDTHRWSVTTTSEVASILPEVLTFEKMSKGKAISEKAPVAIKKEKDMKAGDIKTITFIREQARK